MLVAFRRSLIQNRLSFAHKRNGSSLPLPHNLKPLVPNIRDFLRKPANSPHVHDYINQILDRHLAAIPKPAIFYEQVIAKLVEQRFYKEATDIYQRMLNEEVVPTLETRDQMLALVFSLSVSEGETNKAVVALFIDDKLQDNHISRVLAHALHSGAYVRRVARIVRWLVAREGGYAPTQALVSQIAGAQVRSGNIEAAFATIVQHGDEKTTGPYVAMINALRDTKLSDVDSLNLILNYMYEKDIQPDLEVMNSLLSWELHREALPKLWKIYYIMKLEMSTITPNAKTFGILFTSFLQRRAKDLDISPRSVYRDMAFLHDTPRKMKMNTHLLNIALRVFLESKDYAGAYVVLQSFHFWNIRVSASTYATVLRHITHRILTAVEDKTEMKYRWSCAFLGISAQELRALDAGADVGLVNNILAFSKTSTFQLSRGVFEERPSGVDKYATPTLQQIKMSPTSHAFSALPLQRIMRRAIVAGEPSSGYWSSWEYLKEMVREAKREMLFRPSLVPSHRRSMPTAGLIR